jgi:hypothetical protein
LIKIMRGTTLISLKERLKMDSLISRQAAIDALAEDMPQPYTPDGSHPADEGIFMAQEIYADCIQTLKELPSARPDRKKGEWIPAFDGKFTGGAYWFSCSKCKRIVPEVRNGGWNFCPKCGADMREGNNE